jgi:hypothetical protein
MALTRPRAYQIYDIDYKQAVRVITLTNIVLSGGAPNSVDSVNLSLNDRVLVAGQSNAAQNGIYYVTTLGSGANGTWSRSIDTDTTGELLAGTIVMVTEGTVYQDTQWKLTTDDPIVIGTTPLIFAQNSAFAFGNVFANGTAVLATTVGDVLTLSAGNNISIVGNNTSKTVSIGVTGISLNSISNGTSNVNVVSSGGNVTVGVAGTSNVAVFSSSGQNVTGYLTASGNITGGNLITSGIISATGNLTAGNITTTIANFATFNSSQGGNVSGTLVSTIANAQFINQTNGAGYVTIAGYLDTVGNVTGGNLLTGGLINATGNITSVANISGSNILGNGRNLTGVNTFSSIAVTGSNTITANSIATALTFTGDTSIVVTANTTTNTVSFAFGGSGESIFATGGDMGLVNEAPTSSEDLGLVTDPVTESYDLGGFFIEGLISNDNFLVNSINGNILLANAVITTTGNITAGNLISNGQVVVTYTPATATGVGITVNAANTQGGTGYADFLRATNTSTGATNPSKTFRLNSTGGIEVVNSAYNSLILSLTDTGGLSVLGPISVSGKQAVNGPAFSAYPSSGTAQTITSGSQQKILFGTEEYDTNGNFASSRFTPTVEGYYQLNAAIRLDGGGPGTGECMIVIYKNGAEHRRSWNQSGTAFANTFWTMSISSLVYADGTSDYFEIYAQQSSGADRTVQNAGSGTISWFNGSMVRGA